MIRKTNSLQALFLIVFRFFSSRQAALAAEVSSTWEAEWERTVKAAEP